jgi:pimeloyl-ACP methyl ester carboxylesterase
MSHMDFVLIPGAGGAAEYWRYVEPILKQSGHRAVAVSFPGSDPQAGFSTYADLVVKAIGDRRDVILVAQSLGGFTAPIVCERVKVGQLIFVNAMIPKPGETAGEWGENTGSGAAREEAAKRGGYSPEFSVETYFLHDLPPGIREAVRDDPRTEAEEIFGEPCRFKSWPDVPIRVIAGEDDRLFPLEFQTKVARERLGKEVEAIPGGHLVALSNPRGLAKLLLQ